MLSVEYLTFRDHRARLLRDHHGEYVLIRGTIVIAVSPTEDAALAEGYRLLGDRRPFLVCRVEREEEEVPATIGYLRPMI